MNKRLRVLASVLTVALAASALAGCGSKSSTSTDTAKKEPKEIKVWSHLTTAEVSEVKKLAQQWADKTGNKVTVVEDKGDMQSFLQAANSSKGPDMMFGLSHDNLGTFQKAGLLDKVPSGIIDESKYASKEVVNAVSFNGEKYAVPLSMEAVALFYNKDLVPEAPKTIDEFKTLAKAKGFKYDINSSYFSFWAVAGNGGYVFKSDNGKLDPKDIGLGNEGAQKGYALLKSFIDDKVMPADIKGDVANNAFKQKQTAFYLSGPWDVKGFKDAGLNFGVAPIPGVEAGKPSPSYLGVQSAFVSAKSQNKTEAWDLMKYLTENSAEALFKSGSRIPVLSAELDKDYVKADPIVKGFADQAKAAIPMPNIPEMSAVWTPFDNNLKALNQGKQDPKATADNIVKQLNEGIAQIK